MVTFQVMFDTRDIMLPTGISIYVYTLPLILFRKNERRTYLYIILFSVSLIAIPTLPRTLPRGRIICVESYSN